MKKEHPTTPCIFRMLDSIEKIRYFCKGLGKKEFLENELVRDASVRNLGVLSWTARSISPTCKKNFKKVPWEKIAKLSSKFAPRRWTIDYGEAWRIIEYELPKIKKILEQSAKA